MSGLFREQLGAVRLGLWAVKQRRQGNPVPGDVATLISNVVYRAFGQPLVGAKFRSMDELESAAEFRDRFTAMIARQLRDEV